MLIIIVNGVYSMDDILTYLESITQPDSLGPEHSVLMQKLCELESSVLKDIPLPSLDMISNARNELFLFECRECFSRGFHLGARLMLALRE